MWRVPQGPPSLWCGPAPPGRRGPWDAEPASGWPSPAAATPPWAPPVVAAALNTPLECLCPDLGRPEVIVTLSDLGADGQPVRAARRRGRRSRLPAFQEAVVREPAPSVCKGPTRRPPSTGAAPSGGSWPPRCRISMRCSCRSVGEPSPLQRRSGLAMCDSTRCKRPACALCRAWDALGPHPTFAAVDLERMRSSPRPTCGPGPTPQRGRRHSGRHHLRLDPVCCSGPTPPAAIRWWPLRADIERAYELATPTPASTRRPPARPGWLDF